MSETNNSENKLASLEYEYDREKDVYYKNKNIDNKEFINESISRISSIYENYNSSLKNINFDDNLIKRCNIDFKMAKEIKTEINRYVYDLGNIELDDDFYY
mgnify:CR=1 FL=1